MGVIYKLKDEVVQFIISQRQSNPLSSCRELAELASQKFGLHLSKSSVHDVLKVSGITTPRGRKPKDGFKIPQEKKKQIQASLSKVQLIIPPAVSDVQLIPDVMEPQMPQTAAVKEDTAPAERKQDMETSLEYEGAGKIFLKAALWDLGVYSEEQIKEDDWKYYLTYAKGVRVFLEGGKNFFIDMPLPIERCIRETADGLINNVKPFMVNKVSDEELFRAGMGGQTGFKMTNVNIVERNDLVLFEIGSIVEKKREFEFIIRAFMENSEKDVPKRAKSLFFSETIENNEFIENILTLRGFDKFNKQKRVITLIVSEDHKNKPAVEEAAKILNGMRLWDDQDRLLELAISAQGLL